MAWDNGFFVVAHDLIEDVYDETQGIYFTEYLLWGYYIGDL
ncbi:unnamed protein product, partial [marine sediment metagenome]